MKRRFLKGLVAVFAVTLGVLLFEVFLRFVTNEPENLAKLKSSALFLYENKPNAKFPYVNGEDDYSVLTSFNSAGFRDDEFSAQKNPGDFRIAVLGDSF